MSNMRKLGISVMLAAPSMRAIVRLICIAVTVGVVAPVSAQTGTWTAPVVLSTGGQGWEAAAAIDGEGNSLALWDEITTQDQLWSVSKEPLSKPAF
jgi:hypothetical protein